MKKLLFVILLLASSLAFAASQSEFAVTHGGTVLGNVPMTLDASGVPQAISSSSPLPIAGTFSGSTGTAIIASGTITSGGVSQQVIAAGLVNVHLYIKNPVSAVGVLCFAFAGSASASSDCLLPGAWRSWDSPSFVPTGSLNFYSATTGAAFNAEYF